MAAKGVCSASGLEGLDPDSDDFSFPYFDDAKDIEEEDHFPKKPGKKKRPSPVEPPYILGTLIVRVVAARDLHATRNGGGFGDFLFGGGKGGGSANPYASVKFGESAQRTSDLYDTLDPVWPRGETMFMDVSLPLSEVTHPDPTKQEDPMDGSSGSLKNHSDSVDALDRSRSEPILSVAVFSSSGVHKSNNDRYPNKKGVSGDSNDEFLGMASVDLTSLFTGKRSLIDAWLPLQGGTGSVRIACEYETTDTAPERGDVVRFTRFCHPADLYPLAPGRTYRVQEIVDKDHALLSYTSSEGWICSFLVHRFMVLCVERHHGAVEACREEWQSITERLTHSPIVGTVSQTVARLPEEGLFSVGVNAIQGGANLLGRWLEGGIDTAVKDVAFATNWDGRFNPGLNPQSTWVPTNDNANNSVGETTTPTRSHDREEPPISLPDPAPNSSNAKDPLPNMPSCPITGEPMLDPVVAADGHTYERAAIARWLQASDKSPLTGSILPHKELVPNYGLLSSLQEQAYAMQKRGQPMAAPKPAPKRADPGPEPDAKSPNDHRAVQLSLGDSQRGSQDTAEDSDLDDPDTPLAEAEDPYSAREGPK